LLPALQRRFGVEIGFLRFDVPVAQILERNLAARDGAHNEAALLEHLEIGVEKPDLGLAWGGAGGECVHGAYMHPGAGKVKAVYTPISAWSSGSGGADFLDFDRVPALALGTVQRLVGALHQGVDRVLRRDDSSDAAAHGDTELVAPSDRERGFLHDHAK